MDKLRSDVQSRFEEVRLALTNQAQGIKALQEAASQKLQELAHFVKMKTKLVSSTSDVKQKVLEGDLMSLRDFVEAELHKIRVKLDSAAIAQPSSAMLKRESEKDSQGLEVIKQEFPRLWGHLEQLRKDLKKMEEKFPTPTGSGVGPRRHRSALLRDLGVFVEK